MHFYYITFNLATHQHKKPSLGRVHEMYNFGRHLLGHHNDILGFCKPCPGLENKYINFILYLKVTSLFNVCVGAWGGGVGHEIYNFLSLYSVDATYQILYRLTQNFLKRKC